MQAFLEDRASEQLMTRLLADAGEDYTWFRRLAQHMFRSHLSPDEQRELLEAAKADTQGDPEKIQAAHDARLLLLKSGMCLSIHESWYLHKVKKDAPGKGLSPNHDTHRRRLRPAHVRTGDSQRF